MTEAGNSPALHIDDDEKEIEQKMIKVIAGMPDKVQARFKVLKVLSDKRSKLSDQFDAEISEIEKKIAAKKKPLYELRAKIISGEHVDFADSNKAFADKFVKLEAHHAEKLTKKKEETTADGEKAEDEEIKAVDVENLKGKAGIPDFWFRSMKNNQMIWELVKEKDEAILSHIRHIESERIEAEEGKPDSRKQLIVRFYFNKNEYFSEELLTLKLVYRPDSEDEIERITGTPISWADETKDPTKKKIKKK
jgi:Nucleosome assembly protein (NAP)